MFEPAGDSVNRRVGRRLSSSQPFDERPGDQRNHRYEQDQKNHLPWFHDAPSLLA
jgi:hypothetical protein